MTRPAIAEHVRKEPFDANSNIIGVYINRLRKKLTPGADTLRIKTCRSEGYLLRGHTISAS